MEVCIGRDGDDSCGGGGFVLLLREGVGGRGRECGGKLPASSSGITTMMITIMIG